MRKTFAAKLDEATINAINAAFEATGRTDKGIYIEQLINAGLTPEKPVNNGLSKIGIANLQAAQAENDNLKDLVNKLTAQIEELTPLADDENTIILKLSKGQRFELWGILEICKKIKYAGTYPELIFNMLESYRRDYKAFIFDAEDLAYLKTLMPSKDGE